MVQPNPPDDVLGVNELVRARRRWDAEMAATRRRWDEQYPTAGRTPVPNPPAPDERPVDPDDLDLTRFDHLAEQTDKLTEVDDELAQPPQSPRWIPPQAAP